jgi:cystathionine beta-synthase
LPVRKASFAGNSTGSAIAGVLQMKDMFKEGDVVVVIFPDHGTRYLGKMYNDDWLRDRGFLKEEKLTARDIISKKESTEIVTIDCEKTVLEAINTIKSLNISQIPVTQKGMVIGKITESDILDLADWKTPASNRSRLKAFQQRRSLC